MKIYMDNCCYNRLFDDRSNIKNYLEREALLRELGPVGMVRYLEQYDNGGSGDYTKEKYDMPEMTIDQIIAM